MNTRKHNMEYLGLNDAQYDEHERLMEMPMNQWSESLREYVSGEAVKQGFVNGDSIACWVAEWIKKIP